MKKLILLVLLMMVIVVGCKEDEPIIPEYIVTFYTKGGSNIEAIKVSEGLKITKPEDPTREDYIFSGWYKDAEHTAAWDFDKDVVNGDITLYARWSEIAETVYTVTFDMDGGNEIEPVSVKADETVTEPANPVKIGYKFGGWYSDTEKQSEYDFNTPVTDNITIYAKWEKMEKSGGN